MLYLKVFSQFVFYIFGTFLHEAAHWIGAKITLSQTPMSVIVDEEDDTGNVFKKKVPGFSIVPKIKKDRVVYGHVYAIPKYNIFFMIIAAAPLVWLYVLSYMLSYYDFLLFNINSNVVNIEFDYRGFFQPENWLLIYVSLQLIWAGTLSSQDVKMFFLGLFSISSFIVFSVIFAIYTSFNPEIIDLIKGFLNND